MFTVLLGFVIVLPVYVFVGTTPTFVIQAAIIVFALGIYMIRHRSMRLSSLDLLVSVYIAWILISYCVNAPVYLFSGRGDIAFKQLASLFACLFTISPYLLGRYYLRMEVDGEKFITAIMFSFLSVLLFISAFYSYAISDLIVARHTVAQRIPMMITFVAWGICSLGFVRSKKRFWLIAFWCWATVIVILSLTRGSYFQWAVSGFAFLLIRASGKMSWPVIAKTLIVGTLVIGLVVGCLVYFQATGATQAAVVINRFTQLLSLKEVASSDESASVRIEIWRRLTHRLLESPPRIIVGFGQLGPSRYLGGSFVDISGEFVGEYNAHSQYLDTLIRSGAVGLLLELSIIGAVIFRPLFGRNDVVWIQYFKAHSAALIGVMIYGFFHETLRWQMFGFYFWLYAGISSRYMFSMTRTVEMPATDPADRSIGRSMAVVG